MRKWKWLVVASSVVAIGAATASAQTQIDRSVLPVPTPAFTGSITENATGSRGMPVAPVVAPRGAPNVLLVMSDDVGFAMSSAFGGPVPTPNYDRLAKAGQRYNRFHTTGICSPSRAALLTGRNHHAAGVGWLSDIVSPFPGYREKIQPETATIAQVLKLNGYSTAMFGKHHNIPSAERSDAGPFDAWPTGLGFDYFFGFINGDSDQYSPILYRGIQRASEAEWRGRMLDQQLADDVIRWVHNQKAAAPDKPFFAYLAPGSAHAPHQAPPEYIARFKGRFDQGWDKIREDILRRQIQMGIAPKGTKLTARPAEIPAWDSLTAEQKAFATRSMEVAAAQLAFQDEQVGRVLAELERMGQLDNTMVAVIEGDNGASAEAGPKGTINELRSLAGHDENEAWMQANTERLGGPMTYESYPAGWAWAMNTPFRWTKQYASMLGGIRNGMILSWAGHVAHPGAVCGQFSHLVDIAPTILSAADIPAPSIVNGVKQKPLDGQSLLPSLGTCNPALSRTQYFEIGGKIGLYHDGWFLSGDDGRMAWADLPPTGVKPTMSWTLYDLSKDFSQSTDIAPTHPAELQRMMELWKQEATRNDVFPLDHRFGMTRNLGAMRGSGRKHFDFWGPEISLPATGEPLMIARPFTLTADVRLKSDESSGALVALGSYFGGWSLYLDKGHLAFAWARSTDPKEMSSVRSDLALAQITRKIVMRFATTKPGAPATVTFTADGVQVAQLELPSNILFPAATGETLDIGRDLGVPVAKYAVPGGIFEGDIDHITVDFD